eukprot:6206388-Alexandrium_andersonii.AAC.1
MAANDSRAGLACEHDCMADAAKSAMSVAYNLPVLQCSRHLSTKGSLAISAYFRFSPRLTCMCGKCTRNQTWKQGHVGRDRRTTDTRQTHDRHTTDTQQTPQQTHDRQR